MWLFVTSSIEGLIYLQNMAYNRTYLSQNMKKKVHLRVSCELINKTRNPEAVARRCSAKKVVMEPLYVTKLQAAIFFLWVFRLILFYIITALGDSFYNLKGSPGERTSRIGNLSCKHWYEEPKIDHIYCCKKSFYRMETFQGSFVKSIVN